MDQGGSDVSIFFPGTSVHFEPPTFIYFSTTRGHQTPGSRTTDLLSSGEFPDQQLPRLPGWGWGAADLCRSARVQAGNWMLAFPSCRPSHCPRAALSGFSLTRLSAWGSKGHPHSSSPLPILHQERQPLTASTQFPSLTSRSPPVCGGRLLKRTVRITIGPAVLFLSTL